VCVGTRVRAGRSEARVFFSSPERTERFWGPSSRLYSGFRGCFVGESGWSMKLTCYLHLVPRLIKNGGVPLLPLHACDMWLRMTLSATISIDIHELAR